MNDLASRARELKRSGLSGARVQKIMTQEGYVISLDKIYRLCAGLSDQRRHRKTRFTPEEQAEKQRARARANMRRLRLDPEFRERAREYNRAYREG
jgi:hypothetical protein